MGGRWPRLFLIGLVSGVAGACADYGSASAPWFEEQAAQRGIDFRHQSGFSGRYLLPEIVAGGPALLDVDGDRDLDVYLVQSGSLLDADSPPNRLYLNQGDGRFVAAPAGHGADHRGYGMGAAAGDYDDDGDVDIYIVNTGNNVLLRNDGQGRFEDVSAAAGVDDAGLSTAALFADIDADADLDLFVGNYVDWHISMARDCYVQGILTYCPPQNYNAPAPDRLYRNDGNGAFTDITATAGLDRAFGNGLGATATDFDQDGNIDIFVANDMMVNQLWMNQGDERFQDEAAYRGCAVDEHGTAKAGMGVATGDVDDDGDADLLVVNLRGQTDSFYRNQGGWFQDATQEMGLSATSRRHTRFGVVLADFDNDGYLDLYQANGRVGPREGVQGLGDEFAEPNVLYRGTADGRFELIPDGGLAASLVHTGRGLAVGDVDDDGGLDLLVVNRDAPPYLLMNRVHDRGNWLRFRVVTDSGRDAYGAVVSALVGTRRVFREVDPEGSYLASSDPRPHFGLGAETALRDVKVRWPSGPRPAVEAFGDFKAGRTVVLQRGRGRPAAW